MIISFTGSRKSMSAMQVQRVADMLKRYLPEAVSHGDCCGADAQFHDLAVRAKVMRFIIRPGCDKSGITPTRANCHLTHPPGPLRIYEIHEPERYLVRDEKIVLDGALLIATPRQDAEQFRGSGTWATIRLAHRHGRIIEIVFPDGRVGTYAINSAKGDRKS